MSNKLTKKDYFAQILEFLGDTQPELTDFINKEVAALDAKAAKAKARAAAKKAEPDTLYNAVYAAIGEDAITIDDICNAIDVEGASRSKVVARLTKLKEAGLIVKTDGKPAAYRRA